MTLGMLVLAGVLIGGLYMAWGIGANDVANAMGTSVGSGALTLLSAIILAGILEFAGAVLIGSSVTETVSKGIIDTALFDVTGPWGERGPILLGVGMLGGARTDSCPLDMWQKPEPSPVCIPTVDLTQAARKPRSSPPEILYRPAPLPRSRHTAFRYICRSSASLAHLRAAGAPTTARPFRDRMHGNSHLARLRRTRDHRQSRVGRQIQSTPTFRIRDTDGAKARRLTA